MASNLPATGLSRGGRIICMTGLLGRLLKKVRNERHDWLTEQQPANLEKIRKFQDTGVENIDNRIALLQDPASHQHWIRHLVDEGEAFWFEYQPITSDEASALQADQDLFRRYVLHQWVD